MASHWERCKIELINFLNEHQEIKNTLEVGCGSTSFDDLLRKMGRNPISMDKDVVNIPHDENKFDMVFGVHCFEHFLDPISGLKEVWRVLKKGGYAWWATPYPSKTQTIDADTDHIFCLFPLQMMKLMKFTNFREYQGHIQKDYDDERMRDCHNWNVITWGKK